MANVDRMLSSLKYSYQDRTKRQVKEVINLYKNLHPSVEKCTLPTGMKRDLLVLKGTIPINYRNNVYNIPVNIWLLNNHPESAPICWLNPTKDMTIKVSKNVDQAGRIYLPYLSDWNSDRSDLLGVIQVMIILFGESSPLYSKPKNVTSEHPSNFARASGATPPNPPYPTQFPSHSSFSNVYPAVAPITASSNSSFSQLPSQAFPFSGYPPVTAASYPTTNSTNNFLNSDTISKEHIRLSLLSAVEDKIKARSKEIASQHIAEIDVLRKTSEDLKRGKLKLESLFKEIDINLNELSQCKEGLLKKEASLNQLLSKVENSTNTLNIDEYFGPIQPLYKQLFNAFVEENSIVDAIFHLNEALQKNVIDLDVFIKHVRELSRRQFMARALIKLCREKAHLPT